MAQVYFGKTTKKNFGVNDHNDDDNGNALINAYYFDQDSIGKWIIIKENFHSGII